MSARIIIAVVAIGLPLAVVAVEPNIQPGEWEYRNTMSFDADTGIPDQTHEHRSCITVDDLREGDAFLEDTGDCTVSNMDMSSSGMTYTMECSGADGVEMTMNADMRFMGDRAQGTMYSEMSSGMGVMTMQIDIEGRRVGDC